MEIRPVEPDDAAAVVAVSNPIEPTSFASPRSFRALIERGAPEGTERLVAVVDGAIVAWAPSGVHGDGTGWWWVGVAPPHRRHGIGSALYDRIESRLRGLGATLLRAQPNDDDGRRFLVRRGYELVNSGRLQAVDLEAAELPASGVEVVPLAEAGEESVRELFKSTYADIPADTERPPFGDEDFDREVLQNQTLDRDLSAVVLEDGEAVAFSLVVADHDTHRAGVQMTGVRRDRRGRGLAYGVKLATMHRARAAGIRMLLTANDEANAAMLAVNRKLGFEPTIVVEHYEKRL